MGVTRVLSILFISVAMIAVGCGDDTSGSGGTAGSGGSAGSGGTAGSGGSAGSGGTAGSGGGGGAAGMGGGTGGDGGGGGMNAGCEDDVGGRPAMTGQPSVTPDTVQQGGLITASAPVNSATKYVIAFVDSAFNTLEGSASTTTAGGETVEIEVPIRADANLGDFFFVGFQLCEAEATCTGGTRTNVQYRREGPDDQFYFIGVTDNGASQPGESKFSDCNEALGLTITAD